MAKTTKRSGTRNKSMLRVLEQYGLRATLNSHVTAKQLSSLLGRGCIVIVNYRIPGDEIGHFAVAVEIDRRGVVLADPWLGPATRLQWQDFLPRWYGYRSACVEAGRAIVIDGYQYEPKANRTVSPAVGRGKLVVAESRARCRRRGAK